MCQVYSCGCYILYCEQPFHIKLVVMRQDAWCKQGAALCMGNMRKHLWFCCSLGWNTAYHTLAEVVPNHSYSKTSSKVKVKDFFKIIILFIFHTRVFLFFSLMHFFFYFHPTRLKSQMVQRIKTSLIPVTVALSVRYDLVWSLRAVSFQFSQT